MRTPLCDRLGIEYPIFAFSHCRDVVAAVTNAGGIGVLGAVAHSPEGLETDLAWIDEQVKGKSYGVDLLLPVNFVPTDGPSAAAGGGGAGGGLPAEQVDFVSAILSRHGVPEIPDGVSTRRGVMSVSPEANSTLLDVALAHDIRLVASALGPPTPDLIERAHARDIVVAALVGAKSHAQRQVNAGVDVIVAQGTEAGGHTGQVSTMVLVPEVVRAVAPTPVLAAGGIVTGEQVAAAMALGAQGVWCGSVWLTTAEAETDPVVKQKFLTATSSDTVRSRSLTGKPARMLRTPWTDEWEAPEAPAPLPMPLQSMLVANAQVRIARDARTTGSGAEALATYFVGQGVGLMDRIKPAREVVEEMVAGYLEVAERFAGQLT
ncbi:MAG: NAD(P)H-dependent flavin oxidoreductase [Mycobacteriales bacterium]